MSMFCYQCQEASKGIGCTISGVCGKTPEVANMQDLLLFVVRGVAVYNQELRKEGKASAEADKFVFDGLFTSDYSQRTRRMYLERFGSRIRSQIKNRRCIT